MIVVSDTTALTTLLKAGLEHILPGLFGQVLIPAAVEQELLRFHAALPSWCWVSRVLPSPLLEALRLAVDPGEAEAIALAHDEGASVVLLDDKKGRHHAEVLGLTCLGLPALMVVAKRGGLISSVTDTFEMLASKGRYRVAASAALVLRRSVGEV